MNKEWHQANPMPANPTRAQRVKWHAEHARQCGCRKPPASVAKDVEKIMERDQRKGF